MAKANLQRVSQRRSVRDTHLMLQSTLRTLTQACNFTRACCRLWHYVAIGIDFSEARGMIRKAKGGDVQTALLIADTIGFEVQMATKDDGEDETDNDGFNFM